jgi:outer membrane murein-binding lipoprotein Lpp
MDGVSTTKLEKGRLTMSRRVRVFEWGMMTGLLATAVVPPTAGAAGPPSAEEMWRVIQAQQKTIDELKAKLEQSQGQLRSTSKRVEATEEKVEATAEAVEAAEEKPKTAASWVDRTRIGAYGELHYNNLDNDETGVETDQVDFHRFVIYLGAISSTTASASTQSSSSSTPSWRRPRSRPRMRTAMECCSPTRSRSSGPPARSSWSRPGWSWT